MLIWNVDAIVTKENQMAEMTMKYVGANTQINPL